MDLVSKLLSVLLAFTLATGCASLSADAPLPPAPVAAAPPPAEPPGPPLDYPLEIAVGPSAPAVERTDVSLCPMAVLNAPAADAEGRVMATRYVTVGAVRLLRAPATSVCISSGYGRRNGRLHRGVDLHTRGQGDVLAAGDGVIRKAAWHADFGNMIVIEHGGGVYTLYGHMSGFRDGVAAGARVTQGDALGPIGMTGAAKAPHVHFEILLGAFDTPKGEFGMETVNPFAAPLS